MRDRIPTDFVPRVTQLDALELDQEVVRILKDQLVNIVKFFGIFDYMGTGVGIATEMFYMEAVKSYATFGQQLLGIKYGGERNTRKVWSLAAISFGTKYLQSRSIEISKISSNRDTKDAIHRTTRYLEMGILASRLINFLTFLHEGKYPTLAHRILGLTLVPVNPGKNRNIGYSYMTRELLWHGFIELLVYTLPLINYHYIKRRVMGLFVKKELQHCTNVKFTKETVCPVCGEPPVLPQTIGCAHVYCYYCITAHLMADPQFECAVCGFFAQDTLKSVEM